MKVIRWFFLFCAGSIAFLPRMGSAQAAETISIEDFKRVQADLTQLQEAYTDQMKRTADLAAKVESLRAALREERENNIKGNAGFATRDDLKRVAEKITEVDQRRQSDNKLLVEEIQKELKALGSKMAMPAPHAAERSNSTPKSRDKDKPREKDKEKEKEKEPAVPTGDYHPHKVGKNEILSAIISAYNAEYKKQGKGQITLEQVKRANPKININNIYVGQEILIPEPTPK